LNEVIVIVNVPVRIIVIVNVRIIVIVNVSVIVEEALSSLIKKKRKRFGHIILKMYFCSAKKKADGESLVKI